MQVWRFISQTVAFTSTEWLGHTCWRRHTRQRLEIHHLHRVSTQHSTQTNKPSGESAGSDTSIFVLSLEANTIYTGTTWD